MLAVARGRSHRDDILSTTMALNGLTVLSPQFSLSHRLASIYVARTSVLLSCYVAPSPHNLCMILSGELTHESRLAHCSVLLLWHVATNHSAIKCQLLFSHHIKYLVFKAKSIVCYRVGVRDTQS